MSSDSLPKTMNALLVRYASQRELSVTPRSRNRCFADLCDEPQIKEQGGPEVIQLAEVPVPTINENEVLIKVAVAGIN